MAAPVCTLALKTYSSSTLNLTALTEEGGVFSILHGHSGADWYYALNYATAPASYNRGAEPYRKKYGGELIQFARFADTGDPEAIIFMQTNDIQPTKTAQTQDEINGYALNHISTPRLVMNVAGQGVRYTIPADTWLRKFTWYGGVWGPSPAAFEARATLGDASLPMQTLALNKIATGDNQNDGSWFTCTFRSVVATTITIDVRSTTAMPGDDRAYIAFPAGTLDLPTAPAKPRGAKNIIQYLGRFGGPNT